MQKDQQKLDLDFKADDKATKPAQEELVKEVGEVKSEVAPAVEEIKNETSKPAQARSIADSGFAPECPDCGNILEFSEGCMVCRSCGYSKCG